MRNLMFFPGNIYRKLLWPLPAALLLCLASLLPSIGEAGAGDRPAATAAKASSPVVPVVIDNSGREIVIDQPFRRIISLYPAHTENLASLGLDQEVIGIGLSDDHPPHLLDRPRFSYREDPERYIGHRPDLVLTRPMIERAYPQLIAKLEQAGITVVSLQPTSLAGIFDYWRQLGLLTGRQEAAEEMIEEFQRELAVIRGQVAAIPPEQRRRVFFSSIHRQMKTFAPQSIAIFVLETAGGINVATDAPRVRQTNIADYGKERILAQGDEIDLFLAQQGRMNPVDRDTIRQEPGFGAIRAVREDEIYLVDGQIVSRPTLRIIEGIRQVATLLYPDFFRDATAYNREKKHR
ncbi:ABC transporter substrate-binding protein [Desulfurivibrio alkaliphilus]|uniref:Periplasmic binding protein n=1 Tax=Desulfurivibrio alkaliphilus (strain DSM 19089 / UNIQEM U267 / AHT2) TaxID=589865 RepID=D6Z400_DESAT|nr:ABC transporter substrate-binding protein [Desulfurivibrio alkaliphilus]ADH86275.1 periplasmic binding protein [Desulfurivibrio alkaliphilus AHT 2]